LLLFNLTIQLPQVIGKKSFRGRPTVNNDDSSDSPVPTKAYKNVYDAHATNVALL